MAAQTAPRTGPAKAQRRARSARTLLWKGALLIALNGLLGIAVLRLHDAALHYEPWETDSILLVTPQDTAYDTILLGSSHAYTLSRMRGHHEILEQEWEGSVFNLGLPTGGGVLPERFFLEHFLDQGNSARDAVYFLDPFVLFTEDANTLHKFVNYEPFRFLFLYKLMKNGYPLRQVLAYVQTKFTASWFFQRPEPLEAQSRTCEGKTITPELIQQRFDSLYPQGRSGSTFASYTKELARIMDLCEARGLRLHIVFAPTLLGEDPGASQVVHWLESHQGTHAFDFTDLTNAMTAPRLFADLDHVNQYGVRKLAVLLVPVLRGGP